MATARCGVVIGDESDCDRTRIRRPLEMLPGIGRIGEATDAHGMIALIQSIQPSVVILDVMISRGGGLAVIRWLQQTLIPCTTIVWTNCALPAYRLRCEEAGAQVVFDKSHDIDELVSTIRLLTALPLPQETILSRTLNRMKPMNEHIEGNGDFQKVN